MDNLQEFLKKYSNISNKFIDDFFGLCTVETASDEFIVDLDVLSSWLDAQKCHLKETLMRTYKEDIDYTVQKIKKVRLVHHLKKYY